MKRPWLFRSAAEKRPPTGSEFKAKSNTLHKAIIYSVKSRYNTPCLALAGIVLHPWNLIEICAQKKFLVWFSVAMVLFQRVICLRAILMMANTAILLIKLRWKSEFFPNTLQSDCSLSAIVRSPRYDVSVDLICIIPLFTTIHPYFIHLLDQNGPA